MEPARLCEFAKVIHTRVILSLFPLAASSVCGVNFKSKLAKRGAQCALGEPSGRGMWPLAAVPGALPGASQGQPCWLGHRSSPVSDSPKELVKCFCPFLFVS